MGEIEYGDRRDLAADSGTTTVASCTEGSGRERRAGRRSTGVAAGGGGGGGDVADRECVGQRKEEIKTFFHLGHVQPLHKKSSIEPRTTRTNNLYNP
jgi:hypothetical protein